MTHMQVALIPSSVKGQKLHTLVWAPENPRAIVQISHGMAEHIGRYDHFARWMNEQGIAVCGCSHLGHGFTATSEKDLGFFAKRKGWSHVVEDQQRVRMEMEKRFPGVPYFILGHSMGSFVLRTYLTRDFAKGLAGAIISGTGNVPAAATGGGSVVASISGFFCTRRHRSKTIDSLSFGSYNSAFKPNRTKFDWLTRDEAIVDQYIADDRCGFLFTVSASKDLFKGLSYIRKKKNMKKMDKNLPVLFICGELDPVGANSKGVRQVADAFGKVGMKRVELKVYPQARHEVLNETNRDEVYADVLAFIESVIGA